MHRFVAFLARESAWRNVTIWLGVWSLAYELVLRKIVDWLLPLLGITAPPLPNLSADLWEIIAAILGGGGLSLLARYTDTVISRPPMQIDIKGAPGVIDQRTKGESGGTRRVSRARARPGA